MRSGICIFVFLVLHSSLVAEKPNIIFILVDDMGYSDLGCYGGEIKTPNLDQLAQQGLRFTQFYNTAKCFSSRACLLTGVYAQQCEMDLPHNYRDGIKHAATLGEVLKTAGYRTYASGKHHSLENLYDRGFDHFYGLMEGACNFWNPGGLQRDGEPMPGAKLKVKRPWGDDDKVVTDFTPPIGFYATDAFTDRALKWLDEPQLNTQPFFLYLPYTAPHYPLHAWPRDIKKYEGVYDDGYEAIREARYLRMIELGVIDHATKLPKWDGTPWQKLKDKDRALMKRRMEVYAAMLDCVDQNVGRVLDKLRSQGKLDNTLIMFASDNGACAAPTRARRFVNTVETIGKVESYDAVLQDWATVQNTPLRYWKEYSHEGGICTPFIVYWPGKIANPGGITKQHGHLIDVMPTLVAITGADYPKHINGQTVTPMQGESLLPVWRGDSIDRKRPLFWHWRDGGAIRIGDMKAVFWKQKWQLFDIEKDRNESRDLATAYPEKLKAMKQQWHAWRESVTLKSE